MTGPSVFPLSLRRALRERERQLIAVYLAGIGLLCLALAVGPVRERVLYRAKLLTAYWDDRWTRRLEQGEKLVAQKRYAEAANYLAALDREFPARDVRHARDKERTRLLMALGQCYTELKKRKLATETYQRLVAFDPKNWENNYAYAQAASKLRPNWAMPKDARDQYLAVLKINPNHLPSVGGYITYLGEKGDFTELNAAFESYLDALLLQRVTIKVSNIGADFVLPVDGRFHDVEVPLPQLGTWSGELSLSTHGYSIEIQRVALGAPQVVGRPGSTRREVWSGGTPWQVDSLTPRSATLYQSHIKSPGGTLHLPLESRPEPISTVYLHLRLIKPVDFQTWDALGAPMVKRSFQNRLNYGGLDSVKARIIVPDSTE